MRRYYNYGKRIYYTKEAFKIVRETNDEDLIQIMQIICKEGDELTFDELNKMVSKLCISFKIDFDPFNLEELEVKNYDSD